MEFHYTCQLGRHFAPLLRFLRETGFFEAPVYMSAMSVPAVPLFACVFNRVRRHDPQRAAGTARRFLRYALYLFLCWLAMTSLAVAFKTMIVEELDYPERQWFEPYLPAIHFYVTSACLAYVALAAASRLRVGHLLLVLYTQAALIAGYLVGVYRALHEDFAGAAGGVVLLLFFAVCNYDLIARVRRGFSARGEI